MSKTLSSMPQRALCLVVAAGFFGTMCHAKTVPAVAASDPAAEDRGDVAADIVQPSADADSAEDRWSVHAQGTWVRQHKNAFAAPYSGPQSVIPTAEFAYTLSATLFLGAHLWKGGEMYVNPEVVQGLPFSHLLGLASVNNGEAQKNGGTTPRGYYARAFLRQTFDLSGDTFHVDAGANQLASNYQRRRLVFTAGKLTQTDIFEKNSYANDPRTQFLNWALITHGAWDFAADARGYTLGGASELYWGDWIVRVGRFMEPKIANGTQLNYDVAHYHGDQFEVEHDHKLGDLSGLIRILVFRNRAFAGSYRDAIDAALPIGGAPNLTGVRKDSTKTGYGLSFEQRITDDIGVFARASYGDDKVEEYAFAEIDQTISGGVSIRGMRWGRPDDTVAIAFSSAGLNRDHRDYLAAGGLGGFLGDGQLQHYGREMVFEAYYDVRLVQGVQFTVDFQEITNPGYNTDRRGPLKILGGRLHVEF